jgi:hypothetical protein
MARRLETYEPTWFDREFRKAFTRLDLSQQAVFEQQLGDLMEALQACRHPILDAALQRFKPTPYRIALPNPRSKLAEYRLGAKARVIARYVIEEQDVVGDEILLIAVTVDHDHERLVTLVKGAKKRI